MGSSFINCNFIVKKNPAACLLLYTVKPLQIMLLYRHKLKSIQFSSLPCYYLTILHFGFNCDYHSELTFEIILTCCWWQQIYFLKFKVAKTISTVLLILWWHAMFILQVQNIPSHGLSFPATFGCINLTRKEKEYARSTM